VASDGLPSGRALSLRNWVRANLPRYYAGPSVLALSVLAAQSLIAAMPTPAQPCWPDAPPLPAAAWSRIALLTQLPSELVTQRLFWLGLVGILFYIGAMWASGITQGYMLNSTSEGGTVLTYPNFLETLATIRPLMLFRVFGGALYLVGWLLLVYNVWQTLRGAQAVNGSIEVYADEAHATERPLGLGGTILNPPVVFSTLGTLFVCAWLFGNEFVSLAGVLGAMIVGVLAYAHFQTRRSRWGGWYDRLLVSAAPFAILTFIAVAAGGLIQIVPTILAQKAENVEDRIQVPYTPLELAGRDLYVREGCYLCHSQMIRTLVPDVLRYGDYSRLGESIYDHPFQWGSKRTGPDLARIGGKYPNNWHFIHLRDPRATSAGSNMPAFPWLYDHATNVAALPRKLAVQRQLGVPYPAWTEAQIQANVATQAKAIALRPRRCQHKSGNTNSGGGIQISNPRGDRGAGLRATGIFRRPGTAGKACVYRLDTEIICCVEQESICCRGEGKALHACAGYASP